MLAAIVRPPDLELVERRGQRFDQHLSALDQFGNDKVDDDIYNGDDKYDGQEYAGRSLDFLYPSFLALVELFFEPAHRYVQHKRDTPAKHQREENRQDVPAHRHDRSKMLQYAVEQDQHRADSRHFPKMLVLLSHSLPRSYMPMILAKPCPWQLE